MRKLAGKILRVAAVAIIAVYIVPGLAFPDEVVLCVGEDGRVAVKEARGGHCAASHAATHHRNSGTYEEDSYLTRPRDCCKTCLDIPVSSSSQPQQVPEKQSSHGDQVASPGVCERVDFDVDSMPVRCGNSAGIIPIARSALQILRSVVILI